MTQTTQIAWPAGMVMHMTEQVYGRPGVDLPLEALPQWHEVTLYPATMVARGYVYIREPEAAALRAGDPIQIDRTHAVIRRIGRPEQIEDADGVEMTARRITLRETRYV